MATPQEEAIIIQLALEAKKFEQDVARIAADVKKYATQMKTDFATVGNALKISSPQDAAAINTAVKGLEKQAKAASGVVEEVKKIPEAVKKIPPEVNKATHAFGSMINVVKGAITAMLTLAALRAVKTFFDGAIKAAKEFRGKMAELNFAESILSQKGMDITKAELDKFISDIASKTKYLSTLEVTGIVADVANMGAEFKLAKEDVIGLAEAVAFMQLSEQAFGQEITKTGGVINAALDGRSNYFNKYGINITKTAIKEKAYAMGLAETGSAITKEMSNQAAIALLIEQTTGKFDELLASIEKVDPALANQLRISKTFKDSQLEIGDAILEVTGAWNTFLSALMESGDFDEFVNSVIVVIESVGDFITLLTNGYVAVKEFDKATKDASGGVGEFGDDIGKWVGPLTTILTLLQLVFLGFTTVVGAIVTAIGAASEFFAFATGAKSYEEAGAAIGKHFANGLLKGMAIGLAPLVSGKDDPIANSLRKTMELLEGLTPDTQKLPDTPTSPTAPPEVDEINAEMQEKLDKFNQEILESQLKLQQDMEDAAIDLGRKLYDITVEYEQKRADAYRDYVKKISDINRDFDDKIADINRKQREDRAKTRQDEIEREREFQNKMQELKEKFLMDLDDALHARDARQILRLIKQYNLDKLQAERKHELDQQTASENAALRQKTFNEERKQIEKERQAKLEEAQRDLNEKLAELALDEALEVQAANLKYERQKQDLEKAMQDRLEIVAANLAAEYNLTASWLAAIVGVYQQYYSNVSGIYAAMRSMMSGGFQLPQAGLIGGRDNPGMGGMAQGGSILANRRTNVQFGEAGLEMATFTPLGRTGQDVNKMFSSLDGGSSGADGKVSIELLLSPELESRIVRNTLNKTADVIMRTSRSKG